MKDPRGVERGKCTKCDCIAYELEQNATRAACSYCECPAPAHEQIIDGQAQIIAVSPLSTSFGSTSSGDISPLDASIVIEPEVVASLLAGQAGSSSEVSLDDIVKVLPKKLPKKLQAKLSARPVHLTSNERDVIVRKVVDKLYENEFTSEQCLKLAADAIVQKWSPVKNPLDEDNKALTAKLKRRKNRLNLIASNKKEKRDDSQEDDGAQRKLTPEEAKSKMRDDWASGVRSIHSYRENLAICSKLMESDAKKKPGLQFFREYPAFNIQDFILEVFAARLGMSTESMENNWSRALPRIHQYLLSQKIDCISSGTCAEKTLSVLEKIHLVPLWYKEKQLQNRAARVLELFPANTPLDEMMPGARDPPRLLASGNIIEQNLSLLCYMDSEPFFSVENEPVKALLMLLGGYFLGCIDFVSHTKLPLVLLCSATVGVTKVKKYIVNNNKFMDILNTLKLLGV